MQREARATERKGAPAWLIPAALFGLLVPNGLFIYWAFTEFDGFRPILGNRLALAFIIDGAMAVALLAWHFARKPVGPHGWVTFVVLSLIGGLGFSIPFYWWLNARWES